MMSAKTVVNGYLAAFYTGDFETARSLVADDFKFKGPFVEASNKSDYFSSADRLATIVRGHRHLRQWEDGNDVATIYEVTLETPAGVGAVVMSEWHVVKDGKLISGRVIFDTAAFRAIVPKPK